MSISRIILLFQSKIVKDSYWKLSPGERIPIGLRKLGIRFDLPPLSVPLLHIVFPTQAFAICSGNVTSGTGSAKFNELCGLILL